MRRKLAFYERHGVEEYSIYAPDRGPLESWIWHGNQLQAIPRPDGWCNPRLGLRFALGDGILHLYRPDGRELESYLAVHQRAEQEHQRALRLAYVLQGWSWER